MTNLKFCIFSFHLTEAIGQSIYLVWGWGEGMLECLWLVATILFVSCTASDKNLQ